MNFPFKQRIYHVMLSNLKQALIISFKCIHVIINWIFQSEWKLNLIIAYDVKPFISLYLVIRYIIYVTFKKIYIYRELFLFQFYPFHYYNHYIWCIIDTFFSKNFKKKKANICNHGFTKGQFYLTYCRRWPMTDPIQAYMIRF